MRKFLLALGLLMTIMSFDNTEVNRIPRVKVYRGCAPSEYWRTYYMAQARHSFIPGETETSSNTSYTPPQCNECPGDYCFYIITILPE